MLANIFLHEVLDEWWVRDVRPRLRADASLFRYADDFVVLFRSKEDADRVMGVLPKRFDRYGLTLHPDKTRLVRFQRPRNDSGLKPESFDLLGFSHHWGRSRKGHWVVRQMTAGKSFRRGLSECSAWLRRVRHLPLSVQQKGLTRKLAGHYGYFGVTGNVRRLQCFREEALRLWRHWLRRRSQRAPMPWDRFHRLLARYPIPPARVVRSIYA